MTEPLLPIVCVGAIYSGSERGLSADILAARTLDLAPHAVCTTIVAASHHRVTDLTEVPSDTVRSQLEHLDTVTEAAGVRIGVLGSAANAEAVLGWAGGRTGPVVLEVVASGPSGETVIPARGLDVIASNLGVAHLVIVSREDAELLTGGEIASLDDAQVAAQRIVNRGARGVVIRCGHLPARFFDAADDPGGDGSVASMASDLFFDGDEFALFETPALPAVEGSDSQYAITVLSSLIEQKPVETALQRATQESVEAVRWALPSTDGSSRLAYDWRRIRAAANP